MQRGLSGPRQKEDEQENKWARLEGEMDFEAAKNRFGEETETTLFCDVPFGTRVLLSVRCTANIHQQGDL